VTPYRSRDVAWKLGLCISCDKPAWIARPRPPGTAVRREDKAAQAGPTAGRVPLVRLSWAHAVQDAVQDAVGHRVAMASASQRGSEGAC
jgi:hypothetical protein